MSESKQNTLLFIQKDTQLIRYVLEDLSHQTRPKIDAGDAALLMGNLTQRASSGSTRKRTEGVPRSGALSF